MSGERVTGKWALLPLITTETMEIAVEGHNVNAHRVWREMAAAAPKPPVDVTAFDDLLAVAECHQAITWGSGREQEEVLRRHGWNPATEYCNTFLQRITNAAIAKAKLAP